MLWYCTVLDQSGRVKRKIIKMNGTDVLGVTKRIQRQGDSLLTITKFPDIIPVRKLKTRMLASVLRSISMLMSTGTALIPALHEAANVKDVLMSDALKRVIYDLKEGIPFYEALEKDGSFPAIVISMCKMGETAGKLPEMLLQAAEHLERISDIKDSLKRAMIYPIILSLAVFASTAFWFVFVLPQMSSLFREMQVELPFLTRMLISIAEICSLYWEYIFGLPLILFFSIFIWIKTHKTGKYALDFFLANLLPKPFSSLYIYANTAFIAEYIYLLMDSGVGLLSSLNILGANMENKVYTKRIQQTIQDVTSGQTIASALEKNKIIHDKACRLISLAEMNGEIPSQAKKISVFYSNLVNITLVSLTKIMEPLMLAILGSIFAIIVGGLLLPVYNLVETIR